MLTVYLLGWWSGLVTAAAWAALYDRYNPPPRREPLAMRQAEEIAREA